MNTSITKNTAQKLQLGMNQLSYSCGAPFGASQHFKQGYTGRNAFTHNGFLNYRADFIVLSEVVQDKKLTRAKSAALTPMSINGLATFLRTSDFWRKLYRTNQGDVLVRDILQRVINFTDENAKFLTVAAGIVESNKDYTRRLVIDIHVDQEFSGAPNTSVRIDLAEKDMYSRKEDRTPFDL